ncbi:MAG: hypothetical protein JOY54_19745 [Acidobacteriaceae bacterium]|nr:hypothetical protein [Acidobacteriaceae bacterium]
MIPTRVPRTNPWFQINCRATAWPLGALSVLGCVGLVGCAPPASIAAFSGAAATALEEGSPLFTDIHDSCVRRHVVSTSAAPSFLPGTSTPGELAACAEFASEAQGLAKVSGVVTAYFRTVQQLASFNGSNVSTVSETAAENAAAAAKWDASQIDSAGKLSSLVVRAVTDRYQTRRLALYFREAQPHAAVTLQALQDVLGKDYAGLLREEQQTLKSRYQRVSYGQNPAVLLLLDHSYLQDIDQLNRRRQAAVAYVQALHEIDEGQTYLARAISKANATELTKTLDLYTSQIETLRPIIQKGL